MAINPSAELAGTFRVQILPIQPSALKDWETEIKEVMDLIIEKNIFAPNGEDIVSAKDAKIVQTETTEFDLIVA